MPATGAQAAGTARVGWSTTREVSLTMRATGRTTRSTGRCAQRQRSAAPLSYGWMRPRLIAAHAAVWRVPAQWLVISHCRPPQSEHLSARATAPPSSLAQGKMVYKSGNVYEGQWVRNVKHGYGEMRWASTAEVYKGQWAGGLQDGLGEHEWLRPQSDGHPLQLRERYAGQWQAGQRSGQGIFVYANGSVYRGGWLANLKHGEGEFFFEDGSVYRGPFEKDHIAKGGVLTQQVRVGQAAARRGDRGRHACARQACEPPLSRLCQRLCQPSLCTAAHSPLSALAPSGTSQSPDLLSDLDLSELVRTEKDPELSAQNVANALARFNSEVKRTYRYYAAMHCSTEDAFTLLTEQLDTLLHDTEVATLELPLAVAHRVFFGALLRPGAGQPKPAAAPKPSVEELVRAVLPPSAASAAEEAPSAAADGHVGSAAAQSGVGAAGPTPTVAASPATQLHAPTRPILLREFGAGLVRLAHARHPHLPSLAQRLHELLVTNIVPNARAAPTEGASVAERERARAVASDALENEWPAVRAVCDLFAPKLNPLWRACAKPSQEDTPAHRQAAVADETARCREFALLLRRTRLVPPGLDVAQTLAVRCAAHPKPSPLALNPKPSL